jgi:hypothetical protein
MKQRGKHASTILQLLLETVFSTRSVQRGYKDDNRDTVSRRRRRKGKHLKSETGKIRSQVPRDSDPRMTALARASTNCKRQIRPLVRESAPPPHQQTRNCLTVIKMWS